MDIGLHLKTFNEKLRYLNKNLVNSENTDLEKEFEELFKITLNMEYLHENNIISIAGLQGVGKSSLIQKIYDIPDELIITNLSIGEKVPILITETDNNSEIHKMYAKVIKDKIVKTEDIDLESFMSNAKNPDETILYLELNVKPVIFGNKHTQFLLLPGFEFEQEVLNESINNFLYSSTNCIFVTNETKQADGENVENLKKVLKEFEANKPLLIITGSDRYSDSHNQEFKKETVSRFGMTEDRVIFTGLYNDEEDNQIWIERFKESVLKYSTTKREFKKAQLKKINHLLRDDFPRCFKQIKAMLDNKEILIDYSKSKNVDNFLQAYDDASEQIINSFLENIRKSLNGNSEQAKQKITDKIGSESLLDQIKSWFKSAIKERDEIKKLVHDAWKEANTNKAFTFAINKTLNEDVQLKLGRKLPTELISNNSMDKEMMLLGNVTNETVINDELLENLIVLSKQTSKDLQFTNENFEASIKLAPSLIVEYIRLNSIYPEFIGVSINPKQPKKENIGESFQEQHKYNKILLSGIGAILGIDLLDGEINSIPMLFELAGGTVNSVGANMSSPLSAIFVSGSLIVAAIQHLNKIQQNKEYIAHDLVDSIRENYLEEFKILIEKPIANYREFLQERLRQRFHLDKELGDFLNLKYSYAQAERELKRIRGEVSDYN
jgi:hypothetical protein